MTAVASANAGTVPCRVLVVDDNVDAARNRLLVAVSGYGRDQDRAQALQAGFDLHFTKPADPEQLLQVLARHRQGLSSPHSA